MSLPLFLRKKYEFVKNLSDDVAKCCCIADNKFVVIRKIGHALFDKKWYQEEKILRILHEEKNKFFPSLIDVHRSGRKMYIICDYIDGVDLQQYMDGHPTLSMVKRVCEQLVVAVSIIHSKNIIHRDIKLENVIVKDDQISLIDWEYAITAEEKKYYEDTPGTILYASPEMFGVKSCIGTFNDVWAIGVIIYCLVSYKFPFYSLGESYSDYEKIVSQIVMYDICYDGLNAEVVDLLKHIFVPYENRYTCQDILNHSWFRPSI